MRFRWTQSLLGPQPEAQSDAVFEVANLMMNFAFWNMKHAAMVAAKPELDMDEAKKVCTTYQNGWRNLKTPKAPSVLLLVMMFMATFSTRWTLAKPKTHSKSAKVDFPQARPDRS